MNLPMKFAILTAMSIFPFAAQAEVTRHPGPPQPPILSAVTITPPSSLVIVSGQIPDPVTPADKKKNIDADYGDTKAQAISCFEKIEAILAEQGMSMENVVKLTVFLVGDPEKDGKMDFGGFAEAYDEFFGTDEQPNLTARSVVQVAALAAPQFLVEIEAIAAQ